MCHFFGGLYPLVGCSGVKEERNHHFGGSSLFFGGDPNGHGSKSHTPSAHPNPRQNRLKWVVHLPQNGILLVLSHGQMGMLICRGGRTCAEFCVRQPTARSLNALLKSAKKRVLDVCQNEGPEKWWLSCWFHLKPTSKE